jgi:hypothetical protein
MANGGSFYKHFIMPPESNLFLKKKFRILIVSCLLEKADHTLHSKQNSSPYSFCSMHVFSFGKGQEDALSQMLGGEALRLMDGNNCQAICSERICGCSSGQADIPFSFSLFSLVSATICRKKSLSAKSLVLILTGSGQEGISRS